MNDILQRLFHLLSYNSAEPMIFSSGVFLWLFAAFIAIYVALRSHDTARIIFVTCFSYYFYYKSSGFYFFLLAVVTVSDFIIARTMQQVDRKGLRKLLVALSLAINLGITYIILPDRRYFLCLVKYWMLRIPNIPEKIQPFVGSVRSRHNQVLQTIAIVVIGKGNTP